MSLSDLLNFMPVRNKVKTLKPSDADFNINNGFLTYPRAHIEVDASCPMSVQRQIQDYVRKGWIKPVANMYDYEYTMDKLKENS
jgi:hypothetical protein